MDLKINAYDASGLTSIDVPCFKQGENTDAKDKLSIRKERSIEDAVGELHRNLMPLAKLANSTRNCAHLLPAFFRITQTQPFHLWDYPQFVDFYDTEIPKSRLIKSGRQVAKSTNTSVESILRASIIPEFKQVYVTPLYEQARRFSSNYVQRFINNSFIKNLIVNSSCEQNVLQKTLLNGSMMFFTYCLRDVERARGIACDAIAIDEVQDINFDFIPILAESMSASRKWKLRTYTGTPKTTDNTISKLWQQHSHAEWVIPCSGCRHENVPSISEDLLNMLGSKGLVCSKCGSAIDTRKGRWIHAFPDRVDTHSGWHVPQAILPMHCEVPAAWSELLTKQRDYKKSQFYNEVLGEECDAGSKLIPVENLKAASVLPHRNIQSEAAAFCFNRPYIVKTLGVDWGGRGEDNDSLTAMSVIGLLPNGVTEVLYGILLPPSMNDVEEIGMVCHLAGTFGVHAIGHDFRGIGMSKDMMLTERGLRRVTPWQNEGNASYLTNTKRTPTNRVYISVNRAAGATLLSHEINNQRIQLPKWENDSSKNVFLGLNSWYENYVPKADGGSVYQVLRSISLPDDIGMSIMYGCLTAWRLSKKWPKFASTITPKGHVENHPSLDDKTVVDDEL